MNIITRLLGCLALSIPLHAATWTVDNNVANPADFRTIQEAVDAAAVGDTILVSGSTQAYSSFTSTKRLNIKGQAVGTLSPAARVSSSVRFDEVYDVQSPDHLRNASGSLLEGLEVGDISIDGMCSGVTIKRCSASNITLNGCSGGMVVNCWASNVYFRTSSAPPIDNGPTRNFRGTGNSVIGTWADRILFGVPANTLVENCVLGVYVGGATETSGPVETGSLNDTAPFVVRNTILIGKATIYHSTASSGNASAVFDRCLSIGGTVLPAGSGNLSVAYTQFPNVFVNATPNANAPETFVLKAGSPAIGAGLGGVDMGMYGGSAPFVANYVPALPRINYLAVPPLVPDSTGLTFQVQAEARD